VARGGAWRPPSRLTWLAQDGFGRGLAWLARVDIMYSRLPPRKNAGIDFVLLLMCFYPAWCCVHDS
jgi:hypothetical protein